MASGESQWITGANARADVHRLRAAAGCVMTGGATVLADDPQLTVRLPADDGVVPAGFRQPDRSEEHTSELQSLMRISSAVFCLKKNTSLTPHTARTTLADY